MKTPLIEGCVASVPSAGAACRGGADRLELCANLAIGGTTPSVTLFRQVKKISTAKINVLIRPRFGDFLYSTEELEEMEDGVKAFRDLGANGVVIGALTPEGRLDVDKMERLMACAGEMEVTLHRAFDMARDPFETLEAAVSLGCRTILTSGQAQTAMEGRNFWRNWYAGPTGASTLWRAAAFARTTSPPSTKRRAFWPSTPAGGGAPQTAAWSTARRGSLWACPPFRNMRSGKPTRPSFGPAPRSCTA